MGEGSAQVARDRLLALRAEEAAAAEPPEEAAFLGRVARFLQRRRLLDDLRRQAQALERELADEATALRSFLTP